MNNKLTLLLGAAMLIAFSGLHAQETRSLALPEAIELSIKNSHQLKNSEAKIEEATAALKEAVDKKLPNASISGSYLWLNSPNIDMKTKQDNSGGGSTEETPKVHQVMYGLANVSMPVYQGGRIRYGIESSKLLAEAAKLDADVQKDEVIQNTVEAYFNLYKASEQVKLVKESLAQSQQRVKEFSDLEKNGLLARNDLLKAQLQASNKELALVDAQNNYQLATVNMDLLLGLPESTQLQLDTAIVDQPAQLDALDTYVQSALTNRKEISSLDLKKKSADFNVKSSKAEQYPSLNLTGGYVAANIPNLLTVTNAVNLGVGVSYDIGSLWKNKAKVQQSEARVKQLVANEGLLNDQVRLEVNKNYLDVLSNQKKIQVYQKAIEQAEENYRITKNKYDNSLATTTDLLDADVAQLEAKVNYVYAKADAIVKYNDLLKAAGMLQNATKK
ncbi:MAG: TolC family protein [Citrobacter freundii]|nr:MAG: TolC family protein [Citrobacter freundii]